MLPRGEVGLIFATIGLGAGVLGDDLYAALLLVVLATTLVTPVLLRWRYERLAARPGDAIDEPGVALDAAPGRVDPGGRRRDRARGTARPRAHRRGRARRRAFRGPGAAVRGIARLVLHEP